MNASIPNMLRRLLVPILAVSALSSYAEVREHTFKFAHVQPKDSHFEAGVQKFAEILAQKSNKKLIIKSYPSGSLGGDMQVVQSLRGGTTDFTTLSPGLLVGLSKQFAVFDMPFLFNDYLEADEILDGQVGKKLLDNPPPGLVGLVFWDHGFRNISTSRRPVAKLEDFQGLKIRVSQSPMIIETIGGLGSNPVPMPFTEVYSALETKAVDGQENPTAVFEMNKFFEVQKYLSITQHQYNPLIVLFSKKVWDQLNDEERKLLQDAANETRDFQRRFTRDMNEKALVSLKKTGTQINEISPQERERMRAKLVPVSEKLAKEQVGEAIVKDVTAELEKIRARKK